MAKHRRPIDEKNTKKYKQTIQAQVLEEIQNGPSSYNIDENLEPQEVYALFFASMGNRSGETTRRTPLEQYWASRDQAIEERERMKDECAECLGLHPKSLAFKYVMLGESRTDPVHVDKKQTGDDDNSGLFKPAPRFKPGSHYSGRGQCTY